LSRVQRLVSALFVAYRCRINRMQNAIVEKVRAELLGSVDTESKVVYFLCETRKILDYQDPKHLPSPLRMFCHWALHVQLTGKGTTKPFVEKVDAVVWNLLNGITTGETVAAETALFREFAFFDTFRSELRGFLAAQRLPVDMCDDDDRWFDFLRAYAGVIEDGSLFCELTTITGVTFTKERSVLKDSRLPFATKWVISLKKPFRDFTKLDIELEGNGKRMTYSYGLRK
jgi:hypothetical protein